MKKSGGKKYIICLVGQLGNGGTEKQLYLFLKYLDRTKYDPIVIVSSAGDGIWREPIEKELKVQIISIGSAPRPVKFLKFGYSILKLNPLAVISWSFYTNIFSSVPGIRKFIGSLRGDLYESKRKLSKFHWEKSLKADHFIANSSKLGEELIKEKVSPDKISVIYNIYEKTAFFKTAAERKALSEKLRAEYKLPENKIIVSTIARNTPEKDIPFFIDVVEKSIEAGFDFHVFFIGGGGPAFKEEIKKRGLQEYFTLAGEIANASRLLPAADIYFLSSNTEGMPNVLLEALDAGCCVLSRDVGGVSDIFREIDSELLEHIVVKERNISEASEKLNRLLADEPLRNSIAQMDGKCLEKFSPERIMPLFEEIIL